MTFRTFHMKGRDDPVLNLEYIEEVSYDNGDFRIGEERQRWLARLDPPQVFGAPYQKNSQIARWTREPASGNCKSKMPSLPTV
jgi:hypothetical protein